MSLGMWFNLEIFETGLIIAVYGKEPEDDRGKFHVQSYCFQMLQKQVPRPVIESDK